MPGFFSKASLTTVIDPTAWSEVGEAPSVQGITDATVTMTSFALTPGQANTRIFVYYTPVTGIKLFNSTIERLPETFDGESKGMNLFNAKIIER